MDANVHVGVSTMKVYIHLPSLYQVFFVPGSRCTKESIDG